MAPLRPRGGSGEGGAVAPVEAPPAAPRPEPAPGYPGTAAASFASSPAGVVDLVPAAEAGPGFALKAAMFAFGALSGVVVVFVALWLTGLGDRVLR